MNNLFTFIIITYLSLGKLTTAYLLPKPTPKVPRKNQYNNSINNEIGIEGSIKNEENEQLENVILNQLSEGNDLIIDPATLIEKIFEQFDDIHDNLDSDIITQNSPINEDRYYVINPNINNQIGHMDLSENLESDTEELSNNLEEADIIEFRNGVSDEPKVPNKRNILHKLKNAKIDNSKENKKFSKPQKKKVQKKKISKKHIQKKKNSKKQHQNKMTHLKLKIQTTNTITFI
ncbi:hypothetical protein SNEBB_004285 [Seison nebaliae]|nr:hypothetical protein SNEBB_004285 [Seison nebaliae]